MVDDIFWLEVSDGVYFSSGGGWWWMVVGGGTVYNSPLVMHFFPR